MRRYAELHRCRQAEGWNEMTQAYRWRRDSGAELSPEGWRGERETGRAWATTREPCIARATLGYDYTENHHVRYIESKTICVLYAVVDCSSNSAGRLEDGKTNLFERFDGLCNAYIFCIYHISKDCEWIEQAIELKRYEKNVQKSPSIHQGLATSLLSFFLLN